MGNQRVHRKIEASGEQPLHTDRANTRELFGSPRETKSLTGEVCGANKQSNWGGGNVAQRGNIP